MKLKKILFLLIFLVFTTQGYSTHYVSVCHNGGQFASQLFAYAMALGYAWDHDLEPLFSERVILNEPNGELNFHYVFHRLPTQAPPGVDINEPLTHYYNYMGDNPPPYQGGSVCLCGCKTQPSYFHHHRQRIRDFFAPSEEIMAELQEKYALILNHPKTVALHVRTYHPGYSMHLFIGASYYLEAMKYFSDDHLYVVFSDRIDWCKKQPLFYGKNVVFIEGNNHIIDFYLMTQCKNIITANSTFSWWAAYLKKDEAGLIIAPRKWWPKAYDKDATHNIMKRNFYPADWIIISNKEEPSHNYDLLNYESTSLHEQW